MIAVPVVSTRYYEAMSTQAMPAIFFGHGNPMNALARNAFTDGWSAIGRSIPRPKAILSVSAHWYVPGTSVTVADSPPTIHDFGGFPRQLFAVQYPAPGSRELAERVRELLAPVRVDMSDRWGLDHGTWSVLVHVYPDADIPVVQLSLDETREASWHYEIAKQLAPLRDEGVLIMGSGNLVHNLHTYAWGNPALCAYDWAQRFEDKARALLAAHDFAPLVDYEALGRDAQLSAPTPEHYLPLVYVLAQYRRGDAVTFPVEGFDGGSISMLAVAIG
jgi:4,5-DOPA dioxygenase extradiol